MGEKCGRTVWKAEEEAGTVRHRGTSRTREAEAGTARRQNVVSKKNSGSAWGSAKRPPGRQATRATNKR